MDNTARPFSVPGPDKKPMTLSDLPPASISRWVTRRKAQVVAAVAGGLLTRNAACERYNLTDEEFDAWEGLYSRHGSKGLRTTQLQQYRK
jgi:hypothetical protein